MMELFLIQIAPYILWTLYFISIPTSIILSCKKCIRSDGYITLADLLFYVFISLIPIGSLLIISTYIDLDDVIIYDKRNKQ